MGGQIVDATIVAAPKQRNTEEEKAAIRDGRIPEEQETVRNLVWDRLIDQFAKNLSSNRIAN